MAPPKTRQTRTTATGLGGGGALLNIANDQNAFGGLGGGPHAKKATKRKADPASPVRNDKAKRSALGNLTNAVANAKENAGPPNAGAAAAAAAGTLFLKQMVTRKRDGLAELMPLGSSNCANQLQPLQPAAAVGKQPLADSGHRQNAENVCGSVHANSKQQQLAQQQQCLAAPRPTKVLTRAAARATLPGDTNVKPPVAKKSQQQQQQQQLQQLQFGQGAADDGGTNVSSVVNALAISDSMKQQLLLLDVPAKPRRRISNDFDRTKAEAPQSGGGGGGLANDTDPDNNSLYMSALESCDSDRLSLLLSDSQSQVPLTRRSSRHSTASAAANGLHNLSGSSAYSTTSTLALGELHIDGATAAAPYDSAQSPFDQIAQSQVPPGVTDFDRENWDDPFQASHYAMDIFNYLKTREPLFAVDDYIGRQLHISKWMRSLLVDWMVEVQETFELNHETLYLAVKVVDLYLARVVVVKDKLQLLGAAAMFLACKYDERTPPLIDDFLYICDGAYVQKELIVMEMDVFRTIGYDLGMPLSYRFLRRYARCAKVPMSILTLARYILEFSLMDYATVTRSESKLAAAALFMALRMSKHGEWDDTLRYYTGYELNDLATVVLVLNNNLHQKPRDVIKTVRNKYSHKIFFEVAKVPLLTAVQLFSGTGVMYERMAP